MKKFACFLIAFLLFACTACTSSPAPAEKAPVVVAVIDTGFSSRAIAEESVMEGKNYLDETLSTEDTFGHGTAIASVILEGAPDALLVPLVSNAYDDGKMRQVDNDTFARMITDAVDVYGCDIINISAGLVLDRDAVREAIAYAEEQGVLVVASAGNDYAEYGAQRYYPAAYDTVLAVGSVNLEGSAVSAFSQRGDWVDLYACGEKVAIRTLSGGTRTSEGTSYSAAKVTARAAQILSSAEKRMAPHELRAHILDKASTLPDGTKYMP